MAPFSPSGFFRAPSLSAHPSPVVASGRNVSLLCSSESTSGTFHLLKERGADPPQHMESKWWPDTRRWQALFPMGPTNTSHGGTYRCYGSQSSYVYQWSWPSDPLRLEVTGEGTTTAQSRLFTRPKMTDLILVSSGSSGVMGVGDTDLLRTDHRREAGEGGGTCENSAVPVSNVGVFPRCHCSLFPRCVQGTLPLSPAGHAGAVWRTPEPPVSLGGRL